MSSFEAYDAAESLERFLGDPLDPANVLSYRSVVEHDEQERFPEAACARLNEWGFPRQTVPRAHLGELDSHESLQALLRVLSRRDVGVALGYGLITYMAAIGAWVAGDERQKRELARRLLAGEQLAVAFHERGNGNDVLASETAAPRASEGFSLTGEKWLINNVRRGAGLAVFARTDPGGGPRGFSLFLAWKDEIDSAACAPLPRIKTLGVRASDISGMRFEGCRLPASALVGAPGTGFEVALKSFQVTRTLMPALALGAADTALRCTLAFTLSRHLYGRRVFDLSHARSVLAGALLDLFACDCLLASGARALHVATEQASVVSAVVKAFVSATLDRTVRELSVVLGARHYLREGHWDGIYQKILRDLPAINVGHAGTAVCLYSLVLQLPQLLRERRREHRDREALAARLEHAFTLGTPVPKLAPERLDLTARGNNDVLDGLAITLARLRDEGRTGAPGDPVLPEVLALGGRLLAAVEELATQVGRPHGGAPGWEKSSAALDLARLYCRLHAAAACIHCWAWNRGRWDELGAHGEWLVLVLERFLAAAERPVGSGERRERLAEGLVRLDREQRLFALVPVRLGGAA